MKSTRLHRFFVFVCYQILITIFFDCCRAQTGHYTQQSRNAINAGTSETTFERASNCHKKKRENETFGKVKCGETDKDKLQPHHTELFERKNRRQCGFTRCQVVDQTTR